MRDNIVKRMLRNLGGLKAFAAIGVLFVLLAAAGLLIAERSLDEKPLPPREKIASARSDCTPIRSVPFNIVEPGRYCLQSDVRTDGDGVVIAADFVTLDLQGHTITGPENGKGDVTGIKGHLVSNVHITNGTVRGFDIGISILSDYGDPTKGFNQIDRVRVEGSGQSGIRMYGNFNRLFDSEVRNIGGGPPTDLVHTHAILSAGPGAIIARNRIFEVRGGDVEKKTEGIGIAVTSIVNGAIVADNTVEFISVFSRQDEWAAPSPSTYGIWVGGDGMTNAAIYGNRIKNAVNGIVVDTHISAVISQNEIVDTAVPITERGARSEKKGMAAGAAGYTPSEEDKRRPAGFVEIGGNNCETTSGAVKRLAKTERKVGICTRKSDITFNELSDYIEKNKL
jgi:hypothetical protein